MALVLLMPGGALVSALLPRTPRDRATQALLTVSLSLATAVLLGCLLAAAGIPLSQRSWALALASTTVVLALVGVIRSDPQQNSKGIGALRDLRARWWHVAAFSLAVAVSIAAVAFASRPLPLRGVDGYTSLWAVPAGSSESVEIGVRSSELVRLSYDLVVKADGAVVSRQTFALQPGQQIQATVSIPTAYSNSELVALLYREGRPDEVYRRVDVRAAAER